MRFGSLDHMAVGCVVIAGRNSKRQRRLSEDNSSARLAEEDIFADRCFAECSSAGGGEL
jgi:hypothetical protein